MEDILFRLLPVYNRLPLLLRNTSGLIYRKIPAIIRFGRFYHHYEKRIRRFMQARPDEAIILQQDLLLRTIHLAQEEIPFYRRLPKVTSVTGINTLPIVSKHDIVSAADEFVLSTNRRCRLHANTGGSSGTPMSFFLHRGITRPKEKAHFQWYWGLFGWKSNSRMLMVRGAPLRNNALYEYQSIANRLSISCYELNEANVDEVVRQIKNFRPEYIHAYPSALKILCQYLDNSGRLEGMKVQAVFLGSEFLPPSYKSLFENLFGCPIVNWYGHSECAIHGGYLPGSELYHFFPFYGYIELIDEDGQPVEVPGASGRIIATSFDNRVMPFIRYDTGDYGTLESKKGATVVLSSIDGRTQDWIVLRDGTRVSLTAFIFGQHLQQFGRIVEMQLQQRCRGELIIRVVPHSTFTETDGIMMARQLEASVSDKIRIYVQYVDRLEKTHRGKHRFLIQDLK